MSRRPTAATAEIGVLRLPHGHGLPLPSYRSAGAAGMDLVAAIEQGSPLAIEPGRRLLVPTGIAISLPADCEAQVRPRSGLAAGHGVTVLNAPGTVDADYRGEIKVLLVNFGDTAFEISRGDRIAQLVVSPVVRALLVEQVSLDQTERGTGGFGSTGVGPAGG